MKSDKFIDKFIKLAILVSAAYLAAAFSLKAQLTDVLAANSSVLLWIPAGLTAVNIILLIIHVFVQGGSLTISAILLYMVQLALFVELHIEIYTILGAAHYSASALPAIPDWFIFTGEHVLKAVDLIDAADAFNLHLQSITHQSTASGIALFAMYLITGILILSPVFKAVCNRLKEQQKTQQSGGVMKWVLPGCLAVSLIALLVLAMMSKIPNWYMLPVNSLLLTLDIGDAIQILTPSALSTQHSALSLQTAAVLFRLFAGAYLILLINQLYLRISKGGGKSVEELAEICVSSEHSPEERMLALNSIEQFGSFAEPAIPYLVKILADINPDIREEAARILKEIDPQWYENEASLTAISRLSKALTINDADVKIAAANALGEFGTAAEEAVSRLVNILEDKNSNVRIASAQALGKMGPAAESGVPNLVNMLTDADDMVQFSAGEALGSIGDAAIPHLIKLLSNENKAIRQAAADALEKTDSQWRGTPYAKEAVEEFLKILTTELGPVRQIAAESLGTLESAASEAVPHLITVLTDSDEGLRSAAEGALDKIDPEWQKSEPARNAVSELVKMLIDSDTGVRSAAQNALGKIDPKWQQSEAARKAIPHFVKTLSHTVGTFRIAAAEALGGFGASAKKMIPYLIKVLTDKEEDVRKAAAYALTQIDAGWRQSDGTKKMIPGLVKELQNSDDWRTRSSAASALGEIGAASAGAIPYLVKALTDPDRNVRNQVSQTLEKIDPKWRQNKRALGVIPHLVKMVSDDKWAVRLSAIEALGEFGTTAAKTAPYIAKGLKDSAVDVVNAAKTVLDKVDPEKKFRNMEIVEHQRARTPGDMAIEKINMSLPEAYTSLVKLMTDSDRDVRNAAKKALEKLNPQWQKNENAQKAIPDVISVMSDSRWIVRSSACQTLGEFGSAAASAVPRLKKLMATDSSVDVQSAARKALEKIGRA